MKLLLFSIILATILGFLFGVVIHVGANFVFDLPFPFVKSILAGEVVIFGYLILDFTLKLFSSNE